MIIPDVNLLVYAYNAGAPAHSAARRWWEDLLSNENAVRVPWTVCCGFVRIMTHPAVLVRPLDRSTALSHVRSWLAVETVEILEPGSRHLELLDRMLSAAGAGGNLVTDAHIAALAVEYQAEVHSNDGDFSRFPGLRWRNPLATGS